MLHLRNASLAALCVVALGCTGTQKPAEAPSGSGAVDAPAASRAKLTAYQCETQGGSVVGDIGDGATQRPDYVCPSGAAPRGDVIAEPGGPLAVEGAVCCPK